MKQINYDFNGLISCCEEIVNSTGVSPSMRSLNELKRELNRFFKDSTCREIIFNNNNSLFYGMCVYPIVTEPMINAILQDDENVRFQEFSVEIDSKLLNPTLQITAREFLAILLHEVGHIVNDPYPVEQVRNAIAIQLAKTGDSLGVPKSIQYATILSFGIKDAVHKMTSMFIIYKDGEVLADEFVHMCGFGEDLNSAFDKICRSGMKINSDVNQLTALSWTLALYKNVKFKRIPALRLLRKMKSVSSSQLEKKEMEQLERALNTIDDSMIQEFCNVDDRSHYYILTEDGSMKKSKYAQMRKQATLKSMKTFKEDVYEYTMRSRHIADEDDALYLMRQINLRISVIEDFLNNENVSDYERKEWWKVLDKYYAIRDKLANETTYRYDYSGSVIQVSYPDIVPNRM